MSMLSDHSVDVAFVTQPRLLTDCIYKKLGATEYVLYVRADHPWARRRSIALSELASETLILPEKGSLTQKVVAKAMDAHGVAPRRKMITTTFPVMKEAILQGIGVGVFLMNASAPDDGLAQVRLGGIDHAYEIYAAMPKRKAGLRLAQSFWDELIDITPPACP